jgi:hypothetical protein
MVENLVSDRPHRYGLSVRHAEHFLSRLDRLPRCEVDLALDLYRDADLIRHVLAAATIPEQAERVAISLDDPQLGPFLIVTRDGHFVTCLGRGMRPGEHPVVTRTDLDAIARKVERLREKMRLEEKLRGGDQRASMRLLRRLCVASDSVSREEFVAVAAWEPILGPAFLDIYLSMAVEILEQGPILRRLRPRGASADDALQRYWNLLHAAGHMALLGAIAGEKEHYASLTEPQLKARSAFSWALTGTGVLSFILKGAWAAGRIGKMMLAEYKRALAEDLAFFELLDTLFALLALGTRAKGLRAEIQKAILAAPGTARTPQAKRLREGMGHEVEVCCQMTADLLDADEEALAADLRAFGERLVEPGTAGRDHPAVEDLLRTLPLMSLRDGITDGKKLVMSLALIATTARGGPEQFYLPSDLAHALRTPWKTEDTWTVLEPMMRAEQAGRKPAVREVAVGRNDPCPCGSDRKWKRCCGVA